jgi:hypothetical protein
MANESDGQGGGPAEDMQRQFNDAVAKLTGPGEPLIALGAILLVFVDVVGDLILDEWGVDYIALVPAWFSLAAIVMYRFQNSTLPVRYALLLAVLGLTAGVVQVREILWGLENDFFDYDTSSIIFGLISWAGGVLMLLGAIQLWPSAKSE